MRAHSGDFNVEKDDVYNFFKLFFRGRFIVFGIYRLNFHVHVRGSNGAFGALSFLDNKQSISIIMGLTEQLGFSLVIFTIRMTLLS